MKKLKQKNWFELFRILCAVLIALLIATIIIFVVSKNPVDSLMKYLFGPLSTKRNFFNVIETTIPMVFCALAINVMHKSGLFSMIADSSFFIAGVASAAIAIALPLPAGIHQIVILLAGTILGAMIGILPVLFRKWTGANELVTSLMSNYVFFNFGYWLIRRFFLDAENGSYSIAFLPSASLGKLIPRTNTHYGLFIMIACVIIMTIVMNHSRFGRELELTGANRQFAKYAGIQVGWTVFLSQAIGGALAGLGGSVEMIGMYNKFEWVMSPVYVWDGILINLLAGKRPHFIPIAAFFLSYMRVGALVMSRGGDVDADLVAIIQGITILLIGSERFLYALKKRREEAEALANQQLTTEKKEA